MKKYKIFNEMISYLKECKKFTQADSRYSGIIAHIDYQNPSDLKSYLHYYIDNKHIKSINPGLLFLSTKQDYFKTSRDMVVFFVEIAFEKKINLDTHKPFSNYKLSFDELDMLYRKTMSQYLDDSLEEKDKSRSMKI